MDQAHIQCGRYECDWYEFTQGNNMRLKVVTAACFIISQSLSAQTLEQSVAQAIDNNPQIKQQYAKFESLLKDRDAATSDYYPTVNLHGGVGYEGTGNDLKVDEQLARKEVGVKVTQNLFNGYESDSNVERHSFEAESTRLNLLSDAENLALDVSRVYLNLLRSKQLVVLAERNVKDHEQILKEIRDREANGLSDHADFAQVQARLSISRSALLMNKNKVLDTRAEFMRLVGTKPEKLIEPKVDSFLLPANEQEAVENAIKHNPEIRVSLAKLEVAKSDIKLESSAYYPDVNLELHANYNDDVGGIQGNDNDMRLMLTVSYDIYNGGNTNSKKDAAIWRKEEAKAVRIRAEQKVTESVRLAWNAWSIQKQQLQWLQQNVDAAKQVEIGYQEQFERDTRSLIDVLDAKVELFKARETYIETSYDQRLASYRLLNATGQLTYAMRVAYPEQWKKEVISNE